MSNNQTEDFALTPLDEILQGVREQGQAGRDAAAAAYRGRKPQTPKHNPALELIEKMDASRARQIESLSQTEHGRKVLAGHGIAPVGQEGAQPALPSTIESGPEHPTQQPEGVAGPSGNAGKTTAPKFAQDLLARNFPDQQNTWQGKAERIFQMGVFGTQTFLDLRKSKKEAMQSGSDITNWALGETHKLADDLERRGLPTAATALRRYVDQGNLGQPLQIPGQETRKLAGISAAVDDAVTDFESAIKQNQNLVNELVGGKPLPQAFNQAVGGTKGFANTLDAAMSIGGTDLNVRVAASSERTFSESGAITIQVPLEVSLKDTYDWDSPSPFYLVRDELEPKGLASPFDIESRWSETAEVVLVPDGSGKSGYRVESVRRISNPPASGGPTQ